MTLKLGKVRVNLSALTPLVFLSLFNPPEYVGAMLFCALLHEAGHLIAVKAVGKSVCCIDVMLFGAHIQTDGRLCSYGADALIYSSGAAANLAGAVCAYFAYLYVPLTEIMFLFFANIFYAVFNMLPIRGLDGGSFAESLLLMRFEVEKVWKVVDKVSFVCIILLFFASLWVLYSGGNNFSLLFVVVYLFMNL